MTCQARVLLRAFGYGMMTLAANATICANEVLGLRYVVSTTCASLSLHE